MAGRATALRLLESTASRAAERAWPAARLACGSRGPSARAASAPRPPRSLRLQSRTLATAAIERGDYKRLTADDVQALRQCLSTPDQSLLSSLEGASNVEASELANFNEDWMCVGTLSSRPLTRQGQVPRQLVGRDQAEVNGRGVESDGPSRAGGAC